MSDDEFFPARAVGQSIAKMGCWMKDTVSNLANEIGTALLEDIPVFREQLSRDSLFIDEPDPVVTPDNSLSRSSRDMEVVFMNPFFYMEDPVDKDSFGRFHHTAEDIYEMVRMYPFIGGEVEKHSSNAKQRDEIWRRVVFKLKSHCLPQCVSEEYDQVEDMVVIHSRRPSLPPTVLLVGDTEGDLSEWSY